MTNSSPSGSAGPELTLRAILVGAVVAVITGLSYPYIVLKLGFGPNISVVAAFFGFIALVLILRLKDTNARENNIVQTMGTSSGQTAFMCVLLAAFDMLNDRGVFNPPLHLGHMQIFFWLCSASLLGVLLAVPMRKHYIDEENLTYADGLAAGETIAVLHATREKGAGGPTMALTIGGILSGILMIVVSGLKWFADTIYFTARTQVMRIGFSWSLLSFGSGLLVGWRVCLSMAIGMVISWFLLPPFLLSHGMIQKQVFAETLRWVMWPATGLMVAGGLTSLFLKWHLIVKTFKTLRGAKVSNQDFPIRWVVIGSIVMTAILCVTQYFSLGIPAWITVVSIILSLPLMLVGLRVLGETNWGPISAMSNMMQAVFAVISPGNVAVNMSASGLTGTIATQSEALMQDFRAGKIVGSNSRVLTYAQLIAAPIGAAAVAWIYPVLRAKYGVGGQGLSSPISVKWAGFAELLTKGLDNLPPGCLYGLLVGVIAGIILTFMAEKFGENVPSPAAMGIGMLIPADVLMPFMLGGLAQFIWSKTAPIRENEYRIPLASGLIAGEALVAVALSIIAGLFPGA
jgi:putative OPT family oligopeptide transporter